MFALLIRKELLIELKSKELILSMLVFALAITLTFAFSSNISKVIVSNYASGMFWITILFVTILSVHRSFNYVNEFDAFSMLVLAPIYRWLIFLANNIELTETFLIYTDKILHASIDVDSDEYKDFCIIFHLYYNIRSL